MHSNNVIYLSSKLRTQDRIHPNSVCVCVHGTAHAIFRFFPIFHLFWTFIGMRLVMRKSCHTWHINTLKSLHSRPMEIKTEIRNAHPIEIIFILNSHLFAGFYHFWSDLFVFVVIFFHSSSFQILRLSHFMHVSAPKTFGLWYVCKQSRIHLYSTDSLIHLPRFHTNQYRLVFGPWMILGFI